MEDNSNLFLYVLIIGAIAIILIVIFFAAGTIVDQSGATERENFNVDDISTDFDCHLDKTPSSISSVTYYNGTAWTTLGTGDYTTNGNIVTVDADAMD